MKLLLDTHVVIWMISRSSKLSEPARSAIADPANRLFFSIAGYWEIGIKIGIGKLRLAENWHATIPRALTRNGVAWAPITPDHVCVVSSLPWIHRDPFDRIMVAQAVAEEYTIITGDLYFAEYDVPVLW